MTIGRLAKILTCSLIVILVALFQNCGAAFQAASYDQLSELSTPSEKFHLAVSSVVVQPGEDAVIQFVLTSPLQSDLTLNYSLQDSTAVRGRDFLETDGSIVIPRGNTTAKIKVTTLNFESLLEERAFNVAIDAKLGETAEALSAQVKLRPSGRKIRASSIATQNGYTCALDDGGRMKCFGKRGGNAVPSDYVFPENKAAVAALTGIKKIALGGLHTCVLTAERTVKCWGSIGPITNGFYASVPNPTDVGGLSGVIDIVAGFAQTCALTDQKRVSCFGVLAGSGAADQLFDIGLANVIGLAGANHMCALIQDGHVECWGSNIQGALGRGSLSAPASPTPAPVVGLTDVKAISASYSETCALLNSGKLKCWGGNENGELGNGSTTDSATPVEVSGLSNVKSVHTGENHSCAKTADDSVYCWGSDSDGRLGRSTIPVKVQGLAATASMMSLGPYHTCALLADQSVQCWGSNTYGELGYRVHGTSRAPLDTRGFSGLTQISVPCGISNGKVYCGDASALPINEDASSIASGTGYTCALTRSGNVWCRGKNDYGQVGIGSLDAEASGQVPINDVVTKIAASANHTCAITSLKKVYCWGRNVYGESGRPAMAPSWLTAPVEVSGLTDAVSLALTNNASCALLTSGQVKCWGAFFLAGDITALGSSPVSITGVSNATSLVGGIDHVCALLNDKTVSCFGANTNGQLGNGGVTSSMTPTTVTGLANAVTVYAGSDLSCAKLTSGSLQCWGSNGDRVLSSSMTDVITSPVELALPLDASQINLSNSNVYFIGPQGILRQIGTKSVPPSAIPSYLLEYME